MRAPKLSASGALCAVSSVVMRALLVGAVVRGIAETAVPDTPVQRSRPIAPPVAMIWRFSTVLPLPFPFVAVSAMSQVPAVVGVPAMRPVAVLSVQPGGRFAAL